MRSSVPRVSGSVPPVVLIQPREQISQLPPIEALELAIELERVALELELGALRVLFQEFKYSVKKIFWSAVGTLSLLMVFFRVHGFLVLPGVN